MKAMPYEVPTHNGTNSMPTTPACSITNIQWELTTVPPPIICQIHWPSTRVNQGPPRPCPRLPPHPEKTEKYTCTILYMCVYMHMYITLLVQADTYVRVWKNYVSLYRALLRAYKAVYGPLKRYVRLHKAFWRAIQGYLGPFTGL